LIKEINSQRRRFTDSASVQRISLQGHLKRITGIQYKDDAEKLVRSELSNAQQKLQRIRDLSNQVSEAFLVPRINE